MMAVGACGKLGSSFPSHLWTPCVHRGVSVHSPAVGGPGSFVELTRRTGLSRRIGKDSKTGKPIETHLIRPFARAIDLVGRETELASLRRWLKSEPPISVRVLTGEAGLGKTRLALELAEEAAADGWQAGFLTRDELARFVGQANLAAWGWNARVLAVVDYVSASASDLNKWLRQLVDHRVWNDTGPPLRLLLLERHATPDTGTGWWDETFRGGEGASPKRMLDPQEPVALRRTDEPQHRCEILKQTLAKLGSTLTLPEDEDFERRLAELTWGGVPLLLMMAAVRTSPSATVRPSQTTTPTRLSSRLRTRRAIRRKCSRSGASTCICRSAHSEVDQKF